MTRALNDEAFRASLARIGFWPLHARNEAAIKEFIDADKARWLDVVKKLNISLD
jgi:tripartite-type tricarboxylate transporter receptor subunit TctC